MPEVETSQVLTGKEIKATAKLTAEPEKSGFEVFIITKSEPRQEDKVC